MQNVAYLDFIRTWVCPGAGSSLHLPVSEHGQAWAGGSSTWPASVGISVEDLEREQRYNKEVTRERVNNNQQHQGREKNKHRESNMREGGIKQARQNGNNGRWCRGITRTTTWGSSRGRRTQSMSSSRTHLKLVSYESLGDYSGHVRGSCVAVWLGCSQGYVVHC